MVLRRRAKLEKIINRLKVNGKQIEISLQMGALQPLWNNKQF